MLTVVKCDSWRSFKDRLSAYAELPQIRRRQFIFRGHGSSEYLLRTTIDRSGSFKTTIERDGIIAAIVKEFRRQCLGLNAARDLHLTDIDWELLGRHHGLPTPILDWTQSPYVGAYFAFEGAQLRQSTFVSVWVLDRDLFQARDIPEVRIIDEEDAIAFNVRAIAQRGLFLRIGSTDRSLEELLGKSLFRFDVPRSDWRNAMVDLDEMGINATSLFRDPDGAARTAANRVLYLDAR